MSKRHAQNARGQGWRAVEKKVPHRAAQWPAMVRGARMSPGDRGCVRMACRPPIHSCSDKRMALPCQRSATVTWSLPARRRTEGWRMATFLLDVYCVGVKDVILRVRLMNASRDRALHGAHWAEGAANGRDRTLRRDPSKSSCGRSRRPWSRSNRRWHAPESPTTPPAEPRCSRDVSGRAPSDESFSFLGQAIAQGPFLIHGARATDSAARHQEADRGCVATHCRRRAASTTC